MSGISPELVTHKLKNALQPFHYHLHVLSQMQPASSEAGAVALALNTHLARMDKFIQRLDILTRAVEVVPTRIHLLEMTRSLLLGPRDNSKIICDVSYKGDAEAFFIQADPVLLEFALRELLANAFEAVSAQPEPRVHAALSEQNRKVTLRLEDSGRGFSPEALKRAGEPFFSTKQDSCAGLGIAVTRKILEAHGASVSLSNAANGSGVVAVQI